MMAIADPLREIEALRREIDRAFSELGLGPASHPWRLAFLPGRAARQYPLVNLHDDGQNFYVEALAPGVDPEGFEISVLGNTLTLAGEKRRLPDVPPERIHRSERAAGRFVRTIELPAEIDASKVSAEYKHGLLIITLPRAETARPRRVAVRS
ncbi:MAG: Hsp20/alpha crystallin family protein [Chloroflexi bacterium]|nr:Hsp20/alpha crystallin family protein [Chloroflexota bacterium]